MSLTGIKKSPLISVPFLKKRLRRITALGLRNLSVNEWDFTIHFTLHRTERTVAFYTSEFVANQRSPEWSYLKFSTHVQCLQDFLIRVWITSSNSCRLFLEYDVHLDDSLVPDEQREDVHRASNNSLWLEMFGYRFTDDDSNLNNQATVPSMYLRATTTTVNKSKRIPLIKSYNRLSILRMINAIDAIRTEDRSSAQCLELLQTYVDTNEEYLTKVKERESRQLRVESSRQYLQSQVSIYEDSIVANQEREKLINDRKCQLEQNLVELLNEREQLNTLIHHLNQSKYLLHDILQLTIFRRKDIITNIYRHIYPIVTERKGEYSIASLRLPQAEDKIYQTPSIRERETEIGAVVGFCSHFVLLISQFIQLPLRFPIEYYGASTIKIYDYTLPFSEFSLYPSYDINSFQYGFFLLNRNIGQIMYHCRVGGRHTDYRKTLENLKELMEQYFLKTNDDQRIQLYGSHHQSIDMIMSTHSNGSSSHPSEKPIMRNRGTLTMNSLFIPSRSAISSLIESDSTDQSEANGVDLFPSMNTITPRLTMQLSQQQQ